MPEFPTSRDVRETRGAYDETNGAHPSPLPWNCSPCSRPRSAHCCRDRLRPRLVDCPRPTRDCSKRWPLRDLVYSVTDPAPGLPSSRSTGRPVLSIACAVERSAASAHMTAAAPEGRSDRSARQMAELENLDGGELRRARNSTAFGRVVEQRAPRHFTTRPGLVACAGWSGSLLPRSRSSDLS